MRLDGQAGSALLRLVVLAGAAEVEDAAVLVGDQFGPVGGCLRVGATALAGLEAAGHCKGEVVWKRRLSKIGRDSV